MKLSQLKKVLKEDLAKGKDNIPDWLDSLLQPINLFIENVGLALQNRLSFEDNFYCKVVSLNLPSGIEQEINVKTAFAPAARAYGVLLVGSNNSAVAHYKWSQKNNGNIGVTVTFVSATDADCTLIILLR